MSGNASRTRGEGCDTCGRPLVDWRNPPRPDHPGINCGGTCLACQHEAEEGAPPGLRAPAPVFADRDGEREVPWRPPTDAELDAAHELIRRALAG